MFDVVVIGGGASGIMTSILLARAGKSVAVLEANDRILKKLLVTGNGRCNITNKNILPSNYNFVGSDIFEKVYASYDLNETTKFFENIGIMMKELEDGKMYPMSLQASSVVNALLYEANRVGVTIITNFIVSAITNKSHFFITDGDKKVSSKYIVFAAGGKSSCKEKNIHNIHKILKSMNVSMTKMYPSLVQLKSDFKYLKHLNGNKIVTNAKLFKGERHIYSAKGEVLFTDYGLSGIPIMNLSRHVTTSDMKQYSVRLDLFDGYTKAELLEMLLKRVKTLYFMSTKDFFVGLVPKDFIIVIIKENGLAMDSSAGDIPEAKIARIVDYLKELRINIIGTNPFSRSQVTAGGVNTVELNNDLSLKKNKNIYFCGEIVDVDGLCGGFNLQWAWSSAGVVSSAIKGK